MYQGRRTHAIVHFVLAVVLWSFGYGWVVHIVSAVEAAAQHRGGQSCDTGN